MAWQTAPFARTRPTPLVSVCRGCVRLSQVRPGCGGACAPEPRGLRGHPRRGQRVGAAVRARAHVVLPRGRGGRRRSTLAAHMAEGAAQPVRHRLGARRRPVALYVVHAHAAAAAADVRAHLGRERAAHVVRGLLDDAAGGGRVRLDARGELVPHRPERREQARAADGPVLHVALRPGATALSLAHARARRARECAEPRRDGCDARALLSARMVLQRRD
eukprot:6179239-Pleurochrysis_carterae.AAC.3